MVSSPSLSRLTFNRRVTLSINDPEAPDGGDQLITLDVFPDMTISAFRDIIHRETRILPTSQHLYHNGNLIGDESKSLEELQIGDGEMLALHVRDIRGNTGVPENRPRGAQRRRGVQQDPELIRLQILGSPGARQELERQNPTLADALDDPPRFARLVREEMERDQRERSERQRLIRELNDDPFDIEKQRRIEEMIRQERVMENLQSAMEHNPEVFGRVHLLYIDVEINGHKVKAMVDSGAQATVMSPSCAEACGIMRLVDTRFSGIARGVGTANIIGRVHLFQIKIGNLFLPCSFTVMEGKAVDLLLGLDMLKRHQATIDLSTDKLIIQGQQVSFLGEADIPKDTEAAVEQEPTIPGPAGTAIGQRSGFVIGPSEQATPGPSNLQSSTASEPSAPAARQTGATGGTAFPEEHIRELMALGFPREAAINALQATDGNVEIAAGLLFGV